MLAPTVIRIQAESEFLAHSVLQSIMVTCVWLCAEITIVCVCVCVCVFELRQPSCTLCVCVCGCVLVPSQDVPLWGWRRQCIALDS